MPNDTILTPGPLERPVGRALSLAGDEVFYATGLDAHAQIDLFWLAVPGFAVVAAVLAYAWYAGRRAGREKRPLDRGVDPTVPPKE